MVSRDHLQPKVETRDHGKRELSAIAKILKFPTNVDLTSPSFEENAEFAMVLDAEELLSLFLNLDSVQRKECIAFVDAQLKQMP